ncbi:flagellar hook-associated protein 3 (plasmid) [Arthrobacter sp. ERGS1:01]|uniref:flagellin N-terminal helical domain-containing protein n=1 Tax=Arthrobacter sp. ERGS1:01 TaxID=1704044 RepID=UPI0006B64445|nr:flagellar hook-associated protein 3 [Arthrobacter sp. ERGS1:01]ALE04193.1 flagellar hook-associated protein 3 [Arthrobacter sp. ERGS1:01]
MLTRVTMQTSAASAQRGMQSNSAKLAQAQLNAGNLQKNPRLSDDPSAAADSLAVRAAQAQAAQYGRNIDNGNDWMTTANGALDTSVTLLQRVQYLTLQASSDGLPAVAKEAIAAELDSIRTDLLGQANTKYLGRSVFAGNSDEKNAFADGAPPTFTGAPGSTVQRRIGPDATIRVDADGAAIFGTGADSVFGLIDKISADLRSGAPVRDSIDSVNAALDNVIGQRSVVGARHAELLRAKDTNTTAVVDLENQRAGVEDLDLGSAILDLKTQELAYQASLSVTAKVLSSTLMDFLR